MKRNIYHSASSWLAGLLDQRWSWSKELHAAIDFNIVPVDGGKKQKTCVLGLEHGVRCRVKICWAIERRMFEQSAPDTRGALMLKMNDKES